MIKRKGKNSNAIITKLEKVVDKIIKEKGEYWWERGDSKFISQIIEIIETNRLSEDDLEFLVDLIKRDGFYDRELVEKIYKFQELTVEQIHKLLESEGSEFNNNPMTRFYELVKHQLLDKTVVLRLLGLIDENLYENSSRPLYKFGSPAFSKTFWKYLFKYQVIPNEAEKILKSINNRREDYPKIKDLYAIRKEIGEIQSNPVITPIRRKPTTKNSKKKHSIYPKSPNKIIAHGICEEWKTNKLINPTTNRKIKKGKGVYNKLQKQCK